MCFLCRAQAASSLDEGNSGASVYGELCTRNLFSLPIAIRTRQRKKQLNTKKFSSPVSRRERERGELRRLPLRIQVLLVLNQIISQPAINDWNVEQLSREFYCESFHLLGGAVKARNGNYKRELVLESARPRAEALQCIE